MSNFNFNNFNNRSSNIENITPQAAARTRSLMTYTFGWMTLGLVISTILTLVFGNSAELFSYLVTVDETGRLHRTILYWAVLLSPLAFILVMNFGFNKLSFGALLTLFLAYAACTGISLSVILIQYEAATVAKAFGSAAGLFGLMAIVGVTTKTDLTSFGRILGIGVVAIFIAMLINMFTQSPAFDYLISVIGVAVFTGLVAYNVQQVKRISAESDGSASYMKLSVMAAFTLYLDFVNIFLFLLRIFGRRD
ncbi:MAG: Bax inhibitor/YccA family protein [Bacteroidetes bacterium]|jgi:FtsH-binding integral membrane protein|nr:Bax inhibitor/YccA family protein [Bacteroidota bacterium]